ncbi:MAG TPA: DUF2125 domain-containing protein [Stellaceae bacterium]|jgi:hypothetical protein|nr:DUF2125 domain-containing protein [Stellaceae bacterium]
MRRSTRLGLVILAALLVAGGGYTAFWFLVARRIEAGIVDWSLSQQADKIDLSWQKMRVSGYPAAFRVDLGSAALRDGAITPSPELHIPMLSGTARPWNFSDWRLEAPEGFTADFATGAGAPTKLIAQTADGVVSIETEGGWTLWLTLRETTVEAGAPVLVGSAHATLAVPPRPSRGSAHPLMSLAVEASRIKLPAAIAPLGDTVDELDFAATGKGAVPSGKLADALAAWRDAGGKIELDNLHLKWGALDATATGTIALDQELQPTSGFSGAIQGYDQILTALVQNGQMRASDAGLARIALTFLAKAGPDGKPEIRTAFTIQNGQMFLGPAKLGRVPRITWE